MSKSKKMVTLILSLVMICSIACSASAASTGITGSITKRRAEATFNYGQPGKTLTVTISYKEKLGNGKIVEDKKTGSASGSYTSVSTYRDCASDSTYISMYVYGYVNSVLFAQMGPFLA